MQLGAVEMSKIRKFKLCGLRALNQKTIEKHGFGDHLRQWRESGEEYSPKKINIIIGENGAGKSTLLEMLALIGEPNYLATLARENRTTDSAAALVIDFDNDKRLRIEIDPIPQRNARADSSFENFVDGQCIFVRAVTVDDRGRDDEKLDGTRCNVSKVALSDATRAELKRIFDKLNCSIHYWNYSKVFNAHDIVNVLNRARSLLTGLVSARGVVRDPNLDIDSFNAKQECPFHVLGGDSDRIGLWLADDQDQWSNVQLSKLPSGWKQIVSILSWLSKIPLGSVALIEEPETHLHPKLQRFLVGEMSKIAIERGLQLFVATHSPTFQHTAAWRGNEDDCCLFEATGHGITSQPNIRRLLDALGVRAADVSQSNGVIWVEGPSDRIYLKHWLALWCQAHLKPEPLENVDYSFAFYGGSVLSHFSVEGSGNQFIELLSVNRNLALFIDRDNDFSRNTDGSFNCLNAASAKCRIVQGLEQLGSSSCKCWITDQYTIESYLPKKFLDCHFTEDGERLLPKNGSKTKTSLIYASSHNEFMTAVSAPELLMPRIAELYELISRWNE